MVVARGGFKGEWGLEHRDGLGNLIARDFSIDMPAPPTCTKLSCLLKFLRDCLYVALVSGYHRKRVAYAEKNRRKKILERYRTGSPSPANIWQAIHANLKLTCPVCRKFNVDPLLFGG